MRKNAILLGAVLLAFLSALSYAQVPFVNQPLVPDATAPAGPGFTLTVNGTGFVPNSVVKWNKDALVTHYISGSQLMATVLAADIATASTANVTVVNPTPGGGTSNVALFSITSSTSSVAFQTSVFGTGEAYPETATAADFNGDGKADLVVANRASNSVSILLGKGDGTFQPSINYALGYEIRWVITGDFNGDGRLDLAAGGDNVAQVSILLGNGDGTFQPPTRYGTGGRGAIWGATGDFNGDGKLDLAVAGWGKVSVLLGNGDATFPTHVDYDLGVDYMWVSTGDFNGDGKLDLAVAGWGNGAASILLGNGDGTFQPHVDYPTGSTPRSLVVGDFNGEGKLDLAVDDEGANHVSVLLGNGDGTLQPRVDYSVGVSDSNWVSTADFNGDGTLDLIVSEWGGFSGTTAAVLLGNGDGTFQPSLTYPTGGHGGESGTVADFNGDGRLDVAIPNSGDYTISVLLQVSAGPAATLSPTSLNFGSQLVHTPSQPQTVTLTNPGNTTLDISSIAASANFYQHNNCGSSLLAGASCTITVTFRPASICPKIGTLTVTDNAANSPQTVALSGVGTVVTLSPTSLDFGNQPVGVTSSPQMITLTNYAHRALTIFAVRLTGANTAVFAQTNTCGASVAPGASCTLSVTFTPNGKVSKAATLNVWDDGGDTPQQVTLTGNGT